MAITVNRLLELFEEKGAKDTDNLYVLNSAPFGIDITEECEHACLGIKEIEVCGTDVKMDTTEKFKIVEFIHASDDLKYFKCLTVGEVIKFLNSIKDKNEKVFFSTTSSNQHLEIINAHKQKLEYVNKNIKARKITGGNVFHLIF